jgi:DNA-binding MarR family transcriptional regulator
VAGRKRTIAEIVDNLRRVVQVTHEYSKRSERVAGLTSPQLWAMKVLGEAGPLRLSDLARRMYLHPSTLVGIVDRLEARGYVTRTRSVTDRREIAVALTDEGRETAEKTPEVAQVLLLMGLESLEQVELQVIAEGMELLVRMLGAQELPPKLLFSSEVNRPRSGKAKPPAGEGTSAGKVRRVGK